MVVTCGWCAVGRGQGDRQVVRLRAGCSLGKDAPQEEGMVRVQPGVRALDPSASRAASSQGFHVTWAGPDIRPWGEPCTAPLGDGCGRILSTEVRQTERDVSLHSAALSMERPSTLCSRSR